MVKKSSSPKHAATAKTSVLDHRAIRSRAGSAFVAGCLALSLCPGIALAAGPDQFGQQPSGASGNPAMMQQGEAHSDNQMPEGFGMPNGEAPQFQEGTVNDVPDFQNGPASGGPRADFGEAPTGEQGPSGAAPEGMNAGNQPPQAFGNAFDDEVRQILSDEYGVDVQGPFGEGMPADAPEGADASNPGQMPAGMQPGDAPELPEGAVNVQMIIDSVRDMMRFTGGYAPDEIDFDDPEFSAALAENVDSAIAQREAAFANNERPSDQGPAVGQFQPRDIAAGTFETDFANSPADLPAGTAEGAPQAPEAQADAPEQPAANQPVDSSFIGKMVTFLLGHLGLSA